MSVRLQYEYKNLTYYWIVYFFLNHNLTTIIICSKSNEVCETANWPVLYRGQVCHPSCPGLSEKEKNKWFGDVSLLHWEFFATVEKLRSKFFLIKISNY